MTVSSDPTLQDWSIALTDVESFGASVIWISTPSLTSCKSKENIGRACCSVLILLFFASFFLAFFFFDLRFRCSAELSLLDGTWSFEMRSGDGEDRRDLDDCDVCKK